MDPGDLKAVTRRLCAPRVLSLYRCGLFPMGIGEGGSGPIGLWSPDVRGVLLPGNLRVSKSLRKSMRGFSFTVDADFRAVIAACAEPTREGAWITPEIIELYTELFDRGDAHSVEVWSEGELAGGLYGVLVGSVFAGESMFHRTRDASKAALAHLVGWLSAAFPDDSWVVDTQWSTPHLVSLGVSEVSAFEYMNLVKTRI